MKKTGYKSKTRPTTTTYRNVKLAMQALSFSGGQTTAWNDVSGAQLDPEGVQQARKTEMEFFKSMSAYTRCKRSCIEAEGGKLIDTKWIDVNKGDVANPNYRSRLVGRVQRIQRRLVICIDTTFGGYANDSQQCGNMKKLEKHDMHAEGRSWSTT